MLGPLKRLFGRSHPVSAGLPNEFDLRRMPELLGRNDPVILEIGCNGGSDTLKFLDLFPAARIFAFEPDARAAARFRSNVADSRVTLFDLAVSNTDGTLEFHASGGAPEKLTDESWPADWDLSGSIKKPKGHLDVHPWCRFDSTIVVKSSTLDTWAVANAIDRVDFIWTDVQGAEAEVIAGGMKTLAKTRYFYTEYSNQELYEGQLDVAGIKALLPDFEVVEVFDNDVLLRNTVLDKSA